MVPTSTQLALLAAAFLSKLTRVLNVSCLKATVVLSAFNLTLAVSNPQANFQAVLPTLHLPSRVLNGVAVVVPWPKLMVLAVR